MTDNDLIRRGDALALMQRAVDGYGQKMRGATDKKEKRDWQSMLFAAVDIQSAIAALPAVTVGVEPPFYFDRYINGVRMAEDVCVERETTLERAMLVAARIASKGPNGEAPVLVYRAPVTPAPDAAALVDQVMFLAERLREWEGDYINHDEAGTQWIGNVIPPLVRLEAILALIPKGAAE